MFTQKVIDDLRSERLARLATMSRSAQPEVAPACFRFVGQWFHIGGFDNTRTFNYKCVKAGNAQVALVIDDLAPGDGWQPRGVKVHRRAQRVENDAAQGPSLVIQPERSWRWGREAPAIGTDGKPHNRKVTQA